jgi:hypothetical protein
MSVFDHFFAIDSWPLGSHRSTASSFDNDTIKRSQYTSGISEISYRIRHYLDGSGSRSSHHQAKKVRKT